MEIRNQRNYGIDLLRIVSMFMVVILHTLGHGGLLDATAPGSLSYKAAWLLESAAFCAVNCFALVSGFVGLRSKFRLSSMAALWLQVVFFNVIFALLDAALYSRAVDLSLIIKALQPVRHNAYWYYTAYFGISFLIPLVNTAVEHLDRKTLILCAAGTFLVFSVYPTFMRVDIFKVGGGYHTLWLLVLFFLGACIRKLEPFPKWSRWVWLALYSAAVLLSWGLLLLTGSNRLINYTSPTILLCAISLVMLFSGIRCSSTAQKVITLVAPLTFGVYLVHESSSVRSNMIRGTMADAANCATPVMLLKALGFAVTVFAVSMGADYIRFILFRELRIKERLDKAEKAIFRKE